MDLNPLHASQNTSLRNTLEVKHLQHPWEKTYYSLAVYLILKYTLTTLSTFPLGLTHILHTQAANSMFCCLYTPCKGFKFHETLIIICKTLNAMVMLNNI